MRFGKTSVMLGHRRTERQENRSGQCRLPAEVLNSLGAMTAAASIWFEIWGGGYGPGSKNFDVLGKFSGKFPFFQAISQAKKIDFSGQIIEEFSIF